MFDLCLECQRKVAEINSCDDCGGLRHQISATVHSAFQGRKAKARDCLVPYTCNSCETISPESVGSSHFQELSHHGDSKISPATNITVHDRVDTEWEVVTGASERGGDHLTNSLGYTYIRHKVSASGQVNYWICSKKNGPHGCRARVVQRGDKFNPNDTKHSCQPRTGSGLLSQIHATVTTQSCLQPFVSAEQIATTLPNEAVGSDQDREARGCDSLFQYVSKLCQTAPALSLSTSKSLKPPHHDGSSISPAMNITVQDRVDAEWEVVTGASERGGDHLTNSLGYTYIRHKVSASGQVNYWICSKKNGPHGCRARVVQRGDKFNPNETEHSCQPRTGAGLLAQLRATVATQACLQPFVSAQQIANKAIQDLVSPCHEVVLPLPSNLARNANRKRAKHRIDHPTTGAKKPNIELITSDVKDIKVEVISEEHHDSFLVTNV